MGNELAQRIEEELKPLVGMVLARVSVDLESKRIGKSVDTIDRFDLPRIADNVATQLRLLVGEETAATAARRVRELR